MKTLIKNANVILADGVIEGGSVMVEDGIISSLEPAVSASVDRIHDCHGHWLMPGLVDLHCDVIERDVEVRRGVHVPLEYAIREADRRNASSGITTQFHGISFGHSERGLRDDRLAAELARTIKREGPNLLVDNRTLLRCEISSASAEDIISSLVLAGYCDLLSVMDHGHEARSYAQALEAWQNEATPGDDPFLDRIRKLVSLGLRYGIPTSSHDDDSLERISFFASMGGRISEFPKTREVAEEACAEGLCTVVGGPNAVRGSSHLDWLSASDAVKAGLAGAICSDYHATVLPQALGSLLGRNVAPIHEIVRCLTLNPARAAGLTDRGAIAPGMRADLLEVAMDPNGWMRVIQCWSRGRVVCGFPDTGRVLGESKRNPDETLTQTGKIFTFA